jgi:hypothetical protein
LVSLQQITKAKWSVVFVNINLFSSSHPANDSTSFVVHRNFQFLRIQRFVSFAKTTSLKLDVYVAPQRYSEITESSNSAPELFEGIMKAYPDRMNSAMVWIGSHRQAKFSNV